MCSIIVSIRNNKEFPLVIAANRDEDAARGSSAVKVLHSDPLIVGCEDELKCGTWLAVNQYGLFAAITNQGITDKNLTSRGLFVKDALKCRTLDELLSFVEGANPNKYSKFNVVFGNSKAVFLAHSYLLHSMVIRQLPNGIHLIESDMKFAGVNPKVDYIHKRLDNVINTSWTEYYKLLKKLLANSESGMKVRPHKNKTTGKFAGRFTLSSSILAFSDSGLERYKFHDRTTPKPKKKDGEAIQHRYKDYIDLFRGEVGASKNEEEADEDEEKEELGPKETIMSVKNGWKRLGKFGAVNWEDDGSDNGY